MDYYQQQQQQQQAYLSNAAQIGAGQPVIGATAGQMSGYPPPNTHTSIHQQQPQAPSFVGSGGYQAQHHQSPPLPTTAAQAQHPSALHQGYQPQATAAIDSKLNDVQLNESSPTGHQQQPQQNPQDRYGSQQIPASADLSSQMKNLQLSHQPRPSSAQSQHSLPPQQPSPSYQQQYAGQQSQVAAQRQPSTQYPQQSSLTQPIATPPSSQPQQQSYQLPPPPTAGAYNGFNTGADLQSKSFAGNFAKNRYPQAQTGFAQQQQNGQAAATPTATMPLPSTGYQVSPPSTGPPSGPPLAGQQTLSHSPSTATAFNTLAPQQAQMYAGTQPPMNPPMQSASHLPSPHMPPQMGHQPQMQQASQMPPQQHAMSGYSPQYQQPQAQPGYYQQQPQQPQGMMQRSLDPESIPSVVQVIEEDRVKFSNPSSEFCTTIPATVPPLVTSVDEIEGIQLKMSDGGCARANFIRSSIYQVPFSEDLLKTTGIPFSLVIKPFDEHEIAEEEEAGDEFDAVAAVAASNEPQQNGNSGQSKRLIQIPVSQSEISRCNRCKAYMSPFMRFTDGGKRFQCAMCHHITEVSQTYYEHMDHTGQRLDKYHRPELCLGSYEFRCTAEFYREGLMINRRPHIIFAFEMTISSRPLVHLLSKHLAEVIRTSLPTDPTGNMPPPMVGFVSYNSKIQLYDLAAGGIAHVICDIAEPFAAFTSFLVDPIKDMDKIEAFLDRLPDLFLEYECETESILGPVIEAVLLTCQYDSSNWYDSAPQSTVNGYNNLSGKPEHSTPKDPSKVLSVGKVYLFHCTLPTFGQDDHTPGRLKPRWTTSNEEARRLLGTDREKTILTPEPSKYYSELGKKCVTKYGSGVELLLFPPVNGSYVDVATLSELARLTGSGGVYKYYNDYSTRFLTDLRYSLKATMAFDVVLRIRTSAGLRPVDYVGNFYAHNASDIECATLSAGNSVSVELKYDDKLSEDEFAIIQIAVLYTSVSGDRRVRVHNLALPVTQKVGEIYRSGCCDTIVNHLLRTSISQVRLGEKTIQYVKESLINRTVQILTTYRKQCAQPGTTSGQLILPEALKLLPVYLTGIIKCDAIDGGPEMVPDDKAYAQIRTLSGDLSFSQVVVYPRLLRFEYNQAGQPIVRHIRCALYRLQEPGGCAYLLENGFYIFFYLPSSNPGESDDFIKNVFGVNTMQQIDPDKEIPILNNEVSQYVHKIIREIQRLRRRAMKVYIVRQNIDKNEIIFKSFLYEDKKPQYSVGGEGKCEAPSYTELLCHLHKEIRAQLS